MPADDLIVRARRAFYNADGPWRRNRLFEAVGSQRFARPALHGMDARLEALVPGRPGVFFEAGAHDGYTQSNTYFLERHRGWSGVLVEAIPELHAKAQRRRPGAHVEACALVAPEDAGKPVRLTFGDLMSKVGDDGSHAEGGLRNAGRDRYEVEVPGRTISEVLDRAGVTHVDVMVLDLEGHELAALRGLDLHRHTVEHLVVEMLDLPAQRPEFDALLTAHFEPAGVLSPDDALYRRRATAG